MLEWYGITSGVPWLFLLGGWLFGLIGVAFLYAAWNRRGLRLRLALKASLDEPDSPAAELPAHVMRSAPAALVFEGGGAVLEVGLEPAGGARGPAWVAGCISETPMMLATGVVPRTGWRQATEIRGLARGVLGATGWSVGTSDPLGFFAGRREHPDSELALVLPRFTSLSSRRPVREVEAALAAPRAGYGNELFGIREYRAGDSLRRIHWRSSARHSRLVVREYEPPGVQSLRIVLDPAPPSLEVADQIARIAASEAWDCLREGGHVVITAPGLEPSRSPRDLWAQLEWLARYPAGGEGTSGTSQRGEDVVVVTADPSMLDRMALRSWLVGDAPADGDLGFERVGTKWPL